MRKLTKEYNLKALFPSIANEWNISKNQDLKPENFFPMSGKKVWWICSKNHEWDAAIRHRTQNNSNCPYCVNQKVGYGNDLKSNFPEVAKEWHPTKNGNFLPSDFALFSGKKVWWKCIAGHSWKTSIIHRTQNNSNCPSCSIQTSKPELFFFTELSYLFEKVVHRKKINQMEVDIFIEEINLAIEYDGSRYHKDKFSYDKRKRLKIKKNGIKIISIREMPLKKIFEDDLIIKGQSNYYKTFKIFLEHLVKTISLSHNQMNTISKYLKDNKPKNKKEFHRLLSFLPGPLPGTSLKDIFPEVAKEWHPTKNGDLTPDMISKSSQTKYWWLCKNGHEFYENVRDRVAREKCKLCKTLLFKFPEIAKEWHPTKNKKSPEDVYAGSREKAWFICPKGHEYEAIISTRTVLTRSRKGTLLKKIGCVFCASRQIGYGNDLLSKFPEVAKEWHPTKNGDLTPSEIFPTTNKKYWWLCKNGHSYQATPGHRTLDNTGCKTCYLLKKAGKNNF